MKKIVLLSLIFIGSLSCDNKQFESDELIDPIVLSEQESFKIVVSEEFQEFFALKYDFLNRVENALENGFSATVLADISIASVKEGNHEAFYKILFNEYCEGEDYVEKLRNAQYRLHDKFPVLNSIYSNGSVLSEDQIFSFYNNLQVRGISTKTISIDSKAKVPVCGSYWQQVKLYTCAGLCGAATAGAGTVLCGWACWCMLCTENSAVADAIC